MTILLLSVVMLYAGYNLLIKVASDSTLTAATTTVAATMVLQVAALLVSIIFATILFLRGGARFEVGATACYWAALAGICIGGAEVAYFYLFRGIGTHSGMAANIAVPVVVAGTIVVSLLASIWFFRESLGIAQWFGVAMIGAGVVLLVNGAK